MSTFAHENNPVSTCMNTEHDIVCAHVELIYTHTHSNTLHTRIVILYTHACVCMCRFFHSPKKERVTLLIINHLNQRKQFLSINFEAVVAGSCGESSHSKRCGPPAKLFYRLIIMNIFIPSFCRIHLLL